MITIAKALLISAPAPEATASGTIPATIAIVVIKIGRKRAWFACINAVTVSSPSCLRWLAKSTNIIAFLATNPISIMIPKRVKILSDILANAKATKAPMNESGIENNTTKGREKLSYNTTITI